MSALLPASYSSTSSRRNGCCCSFAVAAGRLAAKHQAASWPTCVRPPKTENGERSSTRNRISRGALGNVPTAPARRPTVFAPPVCAIQTKKFNESLAKLGDKVNALTVSLDLPFAMNRFCGAESIKNMRCGSDYQDRNFGTNWGTLINELKIECRAVFVLDKDGKVTYAQYVPEVTSEPDYDPALAALQKQL